MEKLAILYCEDDRLAIQRVRTTLDNAGLDYDLIVAATRKEYAAHLETQTIDLILAEYSQPKFSGLAALTLAQARCPDVPFIMLSGKIGEARAIQVLKCGAADCVLTYQLSRLPRAILQVIGDAKKRAQRQQTEQQHKFFYALLDQSTGLLHLTDHQSRLKDLILESLTHELRAPLSSILGISQALQEEVYGASSAQQLAALHRIEQSGQQLLELINNILDLVKIETGKLTVEPGAIDVNVICQKSVNNIKQDALKKCQHISVLIDEPVKQIYADKRHLEQILVNLLSNAVKFTPKQGSIGLEVRENLEQQYVDFTVWDTGIGIRPQCMELLFQPFVQLDHCFARKYSGIGLGLPLVMRMVDMHGGSVSVKSEKNKGSRFTVSLPLGNDDSAISPEEGVLFSSPSSRGVEAVIPDSYSRQDRVGFPSSQALSSISPLILVVEDHEQTIRHLRTYFSGRGYHLIIAKNRREALEIVGAQLPSLIVMDLQLPEIVGLDAIRCIRRQEKGRYIPIIVTTSVVFPGHREKCFEVGANAYLSKPLHLATLHQRITTLLDATPLSFRSEDVKGC